MVLVGFFCVLGAIGLLVVGLVRSDPDLVWASIGASAAGGLAVVVASIQRSRALRRAGTARIARRRPTAPTPPPKSATPSAAADPVVSQRAVPRASAPEQDDVAAPGVDADENADPTDEPAEEDVDMADLLVVIELTDEVLVVDLRPRYHRAGCAHLKDREAIPLPVNEAREDGFTPCGLCQPDAALAAAARQTRSSRTRPPTRSRPRPESS